MSVSEATTSEPTAPVEPPAREPNEVTRAVLRELAGKGEFPAVARFVHEVLEATRASTTPTRRIVDLVLRDLSLSNSILRLVNSAYYRRGSERMISTISRAVLVLGVDAVANIALGLTLFEQLGGRDNVHDTKRLMIRSLMTGVHAAELAHCRQSGVPEEAFVCGLLHDLGRLAITFYAPDRRSAIDLAITRDRVSEDEAWRRVVGTRPGDFGRFVAETWRLPDTVAEVIGETDAPPGAATSTFGRLVAFGRDLSAAVLIPGDTARAAEIKAVQTRHASTVPVTARQLEHVLSVSGNRLREVSSAFGITRRDLEQVAPGLLAGQDATPEGPSPATGAATAEERQRAFVHFMEEIALALARGCALNDLFMMILEGMHRGVGCSQVLLGLLSPERDRLRARFALGVRADELMRGFQIRLDKSAGILADVVTARREIVVPLGELPAGVPAEFHAFVGADTWMLMPIDIGSPAIGAFYVGRQASDGPFTVAEQRSLRTLANYAVLAVRQARSS